MISRELVLCLGTIAIVTSLLFLYTRNRISGMEHKINMLFKLIENHHLENQQKGIEQQKTNLINVSDDEESDDESTTDESETSEDFTVSKKIEILESSMNENKDVYSSLIDQITPLEKSNEIANLTVKELKRLCGEKKLNIYSGLNKEGLIELLNNNSN